MKKITLILLSLALVFSLTACGKSPQSSNTPGAGQPGAEGKTYVLKLSTQLNETTPIVAGFKELSKRVSEKTNGKLKLEVYPSAQLGSDEDVIEQAIQGTNVAVLTDGGRMGNYVKDMGIIGMAYFADNYDEVLKVTKTTTFAGWEKELAEKNGIRVLCFNFFDGARHFLTNKPVKTPADLKGVRVRTPGAPAWAESVKAMGATPVAMPWGETYSAIQSKAVDGCEVQHTSTVGSRMYEVVKYLNKTAHFQLINGLIVGEKWFNTLPAEYQKILLTEAREVAAENARVVEASASESEKFLVKNGMEIVEPDVKAFKAAADKAYDVLKFTELRAKIYKEIGK